MDFAYFTDKEFLHLDYAGQALHKAEYEACTFLGCDFSKADFSDCRFIDCQFRDCNLSNARLQSALLNTVRFSDCKLLGLAFETCKQLWFSIHCAHCQVSHSTFFEMRLTGSFFSDCQLRGMDFGHADLRGVAIRSCDLSETIFEHTNLEKADLRQSVNYAIDPESNRLRGARLSLSGAVRLLDKYGLVIERDL